MTCAGDPDNGDRATTTTAATPQDSNFTENVLASGLSQITSIAWATDGSDTLFVTEKEGKLRVVRNGALQSADVASIDVYTNSECGLIGLVVDPAYATNKYVYVFATVSSSVQQVIRFTIAADVNGNLVGTNRTQIGPNLPTVGENHDGGGIAIGPDGNLYFGIGNLGNGYNVGGEGTPEEFTSLGSKIGRMSLDGDAVSTNPYYDAADGITQRDYIWARGFRNPYGLRFHPTTGALWVTEVGDSWEQIFLVTRDSNQGWPLENNTSTTNGKLIPKLAYQTNVSEFGGSLTRGIFYNGTQFPSEYQGNFFFADYNSGKIMRSVMAAGGDDIVSTSVFVTGVTNAVDVAVGPDGSLYYANIPGTIYRLSYTGQTTQNIVVSTSTISVDEGSSTTFTVKLAAAPDADVTVDVSTTSGTSDVAVAPTSLTFTTSNWSTEQTVTVTAADDADLIDEGATITSASFGLTSQHIVVTARDDDRPAGSPRATITQPRNGDTVSGATTEFYGDGTDSVGTTFAEFYVDGVLMYTDVNTTGHYHYGGDHLRWDTTTLGNGPHTLRLTVYDADGLSASHEVTVNVNNGPFNQAGGDDGLVVIDVEHFHGNVARGGHAWTAESTPGASGNALRSTPNIGSNNDAVYMTDSPRLDFAVTFASTGTHYVWVRGIGADGTDDSINAGLDGAASSSTERISSFGTSWTWSNSTMDGQRATLSVPATGTRNVNLWMREDGFVVDKILLTTNADYVPSGTGPAESSR
ncbi:MAG TPA: PQQ-dependent sugar dehydrogenase [Kofleriaceae bacterium]|nr:PQQ-dependent sugar dehydrogenase [Kofleriaceae bacterium]